MMYFEFEAGNNVYRLRLNTRNVVNLEKQLGCNPVMVFGNGDRVPTVTEMVAILHASLQAYNHGITMDKAYDIFDAYIADGHPMTEFIPVIVNIYKASGLMKSNETPAPEEGEDEKN